MIKKLYFIYATFWFVVIFLIIYPLFLISITHQRFHKFSRLPYKIWSYLFFPLAFLKVKKVGFGQLDPKKNYVFIANHSSYLDIPVLTYTLPGYFIYIGKESLTKIPLFGYKFKKLHITLNRKNVDDRRRVIQEGIARLKKGHSVVVFPEGGINPAKQPHVREFKEGAFKMAFEAKKEIVPITLVGTHKVLPDVSKPIAENHLIQVIVHPPIRVEDFTEIDLTNLKEKCRVQIEAELKRNS